MAQLTLTGQSNQVYDGLGQVLSDAADDVIVLTNCDNLVFRRYRIERSFGVGFRLNNCSNIRIETCRFNDLNGGVYGFGCTGGVVVTDSRCGNVWRAGRKDGARGQFVQLNACSGPGNAIQRNVVRVDYRNNDAEDKISIFDCDGTSGSPILVTDNWLRGHGASLTGGGILIGEGDGTHQRVERNVLINTGVVGIGVAGGGNHLVQDNLVFADGRTATDEPFDANSVGVYVINYGTPGQCGIGNTITVQNNNIDWQYYAGGGGGDNPLYDSAECNTIIGWATNQTGNDLSYLRQAMPFSARPLVLGNGRRLAANAGRFLRAA